MSFSGQLKQARIRNSLAPDLPKTEVLDPTLTTSFPVIVPEMITTLAALPVTAALSSSSVVTVTGVADPPPVVLSISEFASVQLVKPNDGRVECNSPSAECSIAEWSRVAGRRTLFNEGVCRNGTETKGKYDG
jgi:hypothetical protein